MNLLHILLNFVSCYVLDLDVVPLSPSSPSSPSSPLFRLNIIKRITNISVMRKTIMIIIIMKYSLILYAMHVNLLHICTTIKWQIDNKHTLRDVLVERANSHINVLVFVPGCTKSMWPSEIR